MQQSYQGYKLYSSLKKTLTNLWAGTFLNPWISGFVKRIAYFFFNYLALLRHLHKNCCPGHFVEWYTLSLLFRFHLSKLFSSTSFHPSQLRLIRNAYNKFNCLAALIWYTCWRFSYSRYAEKRKTEWISRVYQNVMNTKKINIWNVMRTTGKGRKPWFAST